jgi:nicotinamide mononucleotide transporter
MSEEIASYGYFEIAGVVFAIISVVLAIKEKRLCWIAAIISSIAYVPTFYLAKLYTEIILQGFFIVVSVIGWMNWGEKDGPKALRISVWKPVSHLKAVLISTFFACLAGLALKYYSNASFPFTDSAITVFSITTSFMQARKILENWIYWIIIDAVAIGVYLQKALILTAGLYGLYLFLAAAGYREWKLLKNHE